MEHNRYGVWKVKVEHMETRFTEDGTPSYNRQQVADAKVVAEFTIVAPLEELGKELLTVHLNEKYRWSPRMPGTGVRWAYLAEPECTKVDAVVRYDDQYRSRM